MLLLVIFLNSNCEVNEGSVCSDEGKLTVPLFSLSLSLSLFLSYLEPFVAPSAVDKKKKN